MTKNVKFPLENTKEFETFIINIRNYDIQRILLIETLVPLDALNVALLNEKKILKHLKITITSKPKNIRSKSITSNKNLFQKWKKKYFA